MPNYLKKFEIYLDFETTASKSNQNGDSWAVNPALAEIVQIGCIAYKSGKKSFHFDSTCLPPCLDINESTDIEDTCKYIDATTYLINNISSERMLKSQSEKIVLTNFINNLKLMISAFTEKPVIIGHNILNYDIPLLYHRMLRYDYTHHEIVEFLSKFDYIDSLYQHKYNSTLVDNKTLEFSKITKLEEISKYLGYSHDAHDATNDCYASRYLLYAENARNITSIDVFQSKHRHLDILKQWKTLPLKIFTYEQVLPAHTINDLLNKTIVYGQYIGENAKDIYKSQNQYFERCLKANLNYHKIAALERKLKYTNEA